MTAVVEERPYWRSSRLLICILDKGATKGADLGEIECCDCDVHIRTRGFFLSVPVAAANEVVVVF